MTFDEIIEALYSGDNALICEALNTGEHLADLNDSCETDAIHTGFYCKVQTDNIFEVIYLISTQKLCYRKKTSSSKYFPLGFPLIFTPGDFQPCRFESVKNKWIQAYDIATGNFDTVQISKIEMEDQNAESFILTDGLKVSSFSIFNGTNKIQDYPLYPASIPELYKGYDFFSPLRNYNRIYDYYEDEPTYEKYRGTYAQDVEGCDDDFIDDVLGGEPEAYWNID